MFFQYASGAGVCDGEDFFIGPGGPPFDYNPPPFYGAFFQALWPSLSVFFGAAIFSPLLCVSHDGHDCFPRFSQGRNGPHHFFTPSSV